jgi:hypothetical protein
MATKWVARSVGFAASVLLAACGSAVTGGGETEIASWDGYCDGRVASCGGDAPACKAQEVCAKELLRDDIEAPLFDCLASTCDHDACIRSVAESFTRTTTGEQFSSAHAAYIETCPLGNNDVAIAAWLLDVNVLDAFLACPAAATCDEAKTCFEQLRALHLGDCEAWL